MFHSPQSFSTKVRLKLCMGAAQLLTQCMPRNALALEAAILLHRGIDVEEYVAQIIGY